MLLSFLFYYIGVSFEHIVNIFFDQYVGDLEVEPIFRELYNSRLDFTLGIYSSLLIYGIVVFITFYPNLFDLVFHDVDELFVLPIELQSLLISQIFLLLHIQRSPMRTLIKVFVNFLLDLVDIF